MTNREHIISTLKQYKEKNQGKYNILKIGLFGSVIKDTFHESSDVDVVVLLKNQDLFNLIGIKQDLEEQLNLPVDIISYREKMNKLLKRRIDSEAIYV